jgi:hypothetical protein
MVIVRVVWWPSESFLVLSIRCQFAANSLTIRSQLLMERDQEKQMTYGSGLGTASYIGSGLSK